MAYNVLYKKSVHRDLEGLPKAEARRILDRIESELPKTAGTQPILQGKFAGLRKYRVGDYRVIYALVENDVLVLRVGHRRDVYRKDI